MIRSFCSFCHPKLKPDQAEILILGLPYEGKVNTRPGAKNGPLAIREASECIESYSPFFDRDLTDLKYCDVGDIAPTGTGYDTLLAMTREIKKIAKPHQKFVFLGGDHTITYSVIKALKELGHQFDLVHLDAHPDFQDSFENDRYCYATVMRRIYEIDPGMTIHQLGIRTCTMQELSAARRSNRVYLATEIIEGIRKTAEAVKNKAIYLSIDVDGFDPAYAPGTSNPSYGGLTPDHFRLLLQSLKGCQLMGFDVVEVAPNLDPSGQTAIFAAEIIRDSMLAFWGAC
jgi:agmatinase